MAKSQDYNILHQDFDQREIGASSPGSMRPDMTLLIGRISKHWLDWGKVDSKIQQVDRSEYYLLLSGFSGLMMLTKLRGWYYWQDDIQ